MAINKIVFPVVDNPVYPDDYNQQNKYITSLITQSNSALKLTEWDNVLTQPKIVLGSYIRFNGLMYLVESTDETITGTLSGIQDFFIKLVPDVGGDVLTAEWISSITGYTYDSVKDGWYHADGSMLMDEFISYNNIVPNYNNRIYTDRTTRAIYKNQDGRAYFGSIQPDFIQGEGAIFNDEVSVFNGLKVTGGLTNNIPSRIYNLNSTLTEDTLFNLLNPAFDTIGQVLPILVMAGRVFTGGDFAYSNNSMEWWEAGWMTKTSATVIRIQGIYRVIEPNKVGNDGAVFVSRFYDITDNVFTNIASYNVWLVRW